MSKINILLEGEDDLYFKTFTQPEEYVKIMNIQHLAQLIIGERIYEKLGSSISKIQEFSEKVRSFPELCNLSDVEIDAMWKAQLRFVDKETKKWAEM